MQWRPLAAVVASTIRDVVPEDDGGDMALTIRYFLNFQQGLKSGENTRPKVISTKDIAGKTKIYNGVCSNFCVL